MSLLVVAGLGNPGAEYAQTRHNIGFKAIEALAERVGVSWKSEKRFEAEVASATIGGRNCLLVKPQTFMNASGRSLGSVLRYYKAPPERLIVAYDEYQVPLGTVKISLKGSAGGHNGVQSLLQHVGDSFIRYRIGIAPESQRKATMTSFVLGRFTPDEQEIVSKSFKTIVDGLELLIDQGPINAMNHLNRRESKHESDASETI